MSWGSDDQVVQAAPSAPTPMSSSAPPASGGWGADDQVVHPAPGVTPATADQQGRFSWGLPKAMNGVDRNGTGYQKAMAFYAQEHPEIFQGYGQKGNPGRGDAMASAFADAGSMGLSDEGDAQFARAGNALAQMFGAKPGFSPDEAYQAKKDLAQIARKIRDKQYPLSTGAAGVAGAVLPWLTGGGEVKAAAGAAEETPAILKGMEDAPNLLNRAAQVGKVALGSAAQSGATAFNESSGPAAQRAQETAAGAVEGGVGGAVGEAVLGQALPFAWRAGRRAVARAADHFAASDTAAGLNPNAAAAQAGDQILNAGLNPEAFRGDPNALAAKIKQNLDDVAAQHDALAAKAQANAQGAAPDVSGVAPPEQRGADIRDTVNSARQSEAADAGGYYKVLQEANPTVNAIRTRQGAQDIVEGLSEYDELHPDEAKLLDQARNIDDVLPFQDLNAIKGRASKLIREHASARDATYWRMSRLRDAIHDNLANSIADRVGDDAQAAAEGRMAQEQTLGEQMAQAATGTDSAQPAAAPQPSAPTPSVSEMDPMARSELGQALADVAQHRAGPGTAENLLSVIKRLGGVRLKDARGLGVDGGPEVAQALDGRPFVVNNKTGVLTPDGLRGALQQEGWFGGGQGSLNDLTDLIRRDVASGGKVFHPDSDMPVRQAAHDALSEELAQAGVAAGDRADVAARKLALYRAAQSRAETVQSQLWGKLREEADRLGVSHGPETSYEDLLHDVLERHAIQSEGLSPEEKAAYEAAIEHGLGSGEFEDHTDHTFGGARDPAAQAGQPAEAAVGGQNPGGQGAAGQAGGVNGAAGADGRAGSGAAGEVAQPTVTPELREAAKTGDKLWQAYKQKFFAGPIGRILAKDGQMLWRTRDANVPGQFFSSRPDSYENLQALKGVVGEDAYNSIATNEALASLKGSAPGAPDSVLRADGTVDPDKFAKWQARYAQAIRALPDGVADRLQTAADATRALDEAEGAKAAAVKDAQAGVLGKIMGLDNAEDIGKAVKGVFSGQAPAMKLKALASAVKSDPEATAGLRRAVMDHMAERLQSGGPANLEAFLRQNREALSAVFKAPELRGFETLAGNMGKGGDDATLGDMVKQHGLDAALHLVNIKTGGALGVVRGLFGPKGLNVFARQGVNTVGDLLVKSMQDPAVMREVVNAAKSAKAGRAARDSSIEDMTQAIRFGRVLADSSGALTRPAASNQSP